MARNPSPAAEREDPVRRGKPAQRAVAEAGLVPADRAARSGRALSIEPGSRLLASTVSAAQRRRLAEPRLARRARRAEPERRLVAGPRQRHPAPVATRVDAAGADVHRVLELMLGQVLDLVEAELVALVDVERARAARRRAAPPRAPDAGPRARSVGVPRRLRTKANDVSSRP